MSRPQEGVPRSGLVLISVALFTGALGVALYVEGCLAHGSSMRDLGFLAVMGGTLLAIRASAARSRARRARSVGGGENSASAAGRSSRLTRAIGVTLALLGLVLLAATSLSWGIRLFGLAVAAVGVLFVRSSLDRAPPGGGDGAGGDTIPAAVRRFDRAIRVTGIALAPLMALSALALFLTPRAGHEVWPLYTFFVVGLTCALVWAYLFGRLLTRIAMGAAGHREGR